MKLNQLMKCMVLAASVAMGGMLLAAEYAPAPLVFDSPAENDRGSMMLGNGEIGALAWVSKDGTLHTVLQCSDSWNEGGSHVKVGAIDYVTGCKVDANFHQELSLAKGMFNVSWESAGRKVSVHYRVQNDPAQPFVVCDVEGAPSAAAKVINWRLFEGGSRLFNVDELGNRFNEATSIKEKILFRVNADVLVENGWYHLNRNETVAMMMKWYDYWQATADLGKPDYLSNRAFGGLTHSERQGERTLFVSAITCLQPVKDGADWQRQTAKILAEQGWGLAGEAAKRSQHEASWREFWSRSHIVITPNSDKADAKRKIKFPYNEKLPISYGRDSKGDTKLNGTLTVDPKSRIDAEGLDFAAKFSTKTPNANQRLIDNITPGSSDGSLVDLMGGRIRLIVGSETFYHPAKLVANQETAVAVTVDAYGAIAMTVNGATRKFHVGTNIDVASAETCATVTRAWACQRYIGACTGRGRFPIRFNGSIFTTQENNDPDFRRWGHGYWWQNTRLPYYPMLAAGDGEYLKPLFNLYERVLEFNCKRTKKYLGHDGAYFPECMQPWGDHFVGTYGTRCAWKDRQDKLQDAHWHKYEWVGQLELSLMLLDYYAYTQKAEWFKKHALPSIREYVRYFDSHYKVAADGKYDWQPAQALETWLGCTASMPEVAGVRCVTARLLELPDSLLEKGDRELFRTILARTPPLPTRKDLACGECYSVAAKWGRVNNVETPELYCAFPFRLCSFEKDNVELGRRAYDARRFKTYRGWNQDELFAAMLGLTEEAQVHLANRALYNSAEGFRWPAYWGPNFDWRPDQCAGGNIQNIPQLMLMQFEGKKIFLLPAWPKNWNCDFKLHAPYQTVVEGKVVNGKLEDLVVTPASRRADVIIR